MRFISDPTDGLMVWWSVVDIFRPLSDILKVCFRHCQILATVRWSVVGTLRSRWWSVVGTVRSWRWSDGPMVCCRYCQILTMVCLEVGIDCVALHSMNLQRQRLAALAKFKSHQVKVLIATDVASRSVQAGYGRYTGGIQGVHRPHSVRSRYTIGVDGTIRTELVQSRHRVGTQMV